MVMHGGSADCDLRSGPGVALQTMPSVLSLPARWKTPQPPGAGLSNLGNTCYLNSTLQCLAYVPPLGHLCLTRGHSASCPRASASPAPTRPPSPSAPPCTLCLLERQLAAMLRGGRGSAVSPAEVVRQLHVFCASFQRGRQEDAHELLTAMLDVLERDARRAAVAHGAPKGCRTLVEDLFLGVWQSQVRCLSCGHESNTYESFSTLPLDIGQARSVVEGLAAFSEAERLDGGNKYRCDRCRQLVPAVKQTTIWDDPNVLVLHLKRFDAGSLLGKVSRHVAFPETVDLQPFMTPPAARNRTEQHHSHHRNGSAANGQAANGNGEHHNHSGSNARESITNGSGNGAANHHSSHHHHHHQKADNGMDPGGGDSGGGGGAAPPSPSPGPSPGRSTYRLTGVVVHSGSSLHSGHYYAFVRDSNDAWLCMNDSQVYGTSLEAVRREQAYMLFYTRHSMKAPRPPAPQQQTAPGGPEEPTVPGSGGVLRKGATAAADIHTAPVATARPSVYGPACPPHLARNSTAAAATPSTPPAAVVPSFKLPPRPGPAATPSARLPAKVTLTPRVAAAGGQSAAKTSPSTTTTNGTTNGTTAPLRRTKPHSAPSNGTTLRPPPSGGSDDSAPHEPPAPDSVRKRKREDTSNTTTTLLPTHPTGPNPPTAPSPAAQPQPSQPPQPPLSREDRIRAQVEAELTAHKACASWGEGVKRLRTSLEDMLRGSEWRQRARELVLSLKAGGSEVGEVLAAGRSDTRRRALDRAVPPGVLRHGHEEMGRLLRALLLVLSWLGGPLPLML